MQTDAFIPFVFRLTIAFCAALTIMSCASTKPIDGNDNCDRPIATLNDKPVCRARFERAIKDRVRTNNGNYGRAERMIQLRQSVFEKVIIIAAVREAATLQGLTIDEAEVENARGHASNEFDALEAEYALLNAPGFIPGLEIDPSQFVVKVHEPFMESPF